MGKDRQEVPQGVHTHRGRAKKLERGKSVGFSTHLRVPQVRQMEGLNMAPSGVYTLNCFSDSEVMSPGCVVAAL
jgi:hypothetical protein